MIARRACALLLVLCLPAVALGFWGKKSDDEKLKDKLDSLKVHFYLAGKAALTKTAGSEEAQAVKDRLLALASGTVRTVKALQGQEPEPAEQKEGSGLSLKELAGLGKALWGMRAVGKEVLASDKDTLPPVLPVVLTPMGVSPELVARLDRPTDHAALFVALALVKLHPRSPVPIAPEIILYEGTRMDPAQVKIPGFTPQLHGLKAYTLAMSGLCDLAEKEAQTLEALGPVEEASRVSAGLKLLTGKDVSLSAGQLSAMGAATDALAQGSLAICYFSRAAWEPGRKALSRFLDASDRSGIDLPELQVLRAYTQCASDTPEKGVKRLKALSGREDLSEEIQKDLSQLEKVCGGPDADETLKFVSAVRLGKVVVLVTWEHLKRSGLMDALGELEWVKAVRGFVTTLGQGSSKVPGSTTVYASHGHHWDWD